MMEIRTTKEIQEWTQQPVESDEKMQWVAFDNIISDLDDRINGVNSALGNQEDVGYLKALECLLDYYLESNNISLKNKQEVLFNSHNNKIITIGEVRKILSRMFNNLPSGDGDLFKSVKAMSGDIDKEAEYILKRLKDLSVMLANYEDHRDTMQKDEDTSYYDRLVLVGRARIEELTRLKKVLKLE